MAKKPFGKFRNPAPPSFGPKDRRPFNHYTCETCGKVTIAKDEHDGTTPFMLSCHATPHCTGTATSAFYRGSQDPDQVPHVIFYRATVEQFRAYVKDLDPIRQSEVKQHHDAGGLLMRTASEKSGDTNDEF